MVYLLGNVEDARIFSIVAYVKNKLINKLTHHLECSVKLYAKKLYRV